MPIQIVGNEISNLDFAAAGLTTEASITATTSATGNTCISTGAFGFLVLRTSTPSTGSEP